MSAADDLARAAEALPSVRIVRGDAVKLEPVGWLWRGFLPAGMLAILGGAPGCGKTTIALSLAATLTRGGAWPDSSRCAEQADVLIWSGEDPHSVLAARLAASGADMKRVHFVDGVSGAGEDGAFDPGRDMALLESAAEKLPNLRLLIVDPVVSAVAGDSHKNAEVRRALQPVVDLGRRIGCAVLGITHFSKGTVGRDPVERITGSLAFAALARLVLVAAKVKPEPGEEGEPRRVLVRAKSNIGPDGGGFNYTLNRAEVAPGVEGQRALWGERIEGTAREVLADAEAEPEADEAAFACDVAAAFLRDMLKGSANTPSRDAVRRMKAEGYTEKVIRRAREKLGVLVGRSGFGKNMQSLWSLPVLPTPDHSCPAVPTHFDGQEWAGMQQEGTNAAPADDAEVI